MILRHNVPIKRKFVITEIESTMGVQESARWSKWDGRLNIQRVLHDSLIRMYGFQGITFQNTNFSHPQRSCDKVMFLHLCVMRFTGGSCRHTPPGRHAPGQTPPWADTDPPPRYGHCSGRYASYWNASLFSQHFMAFSSLS